MPAAPPTDDDYPLLERIGRGPAGEVWKAAEKKTGKLVAVKFIDLANSPGAVKDLRALNLIKNLNHPNLLPIFTARLTDAAGTVVPLDDADAAAKAGRLKELRVVMRLADKSLAARLKELNPQGTPHRNRRGLPIDELLGYLEGAAKGIDYLNRPDHGLGEHDGPVVHCDINPHNLLLVAGEVQVADSGLAVLLAPNARQSRTTEYPAYTPPELIRNKPGPGTDQYSLAVCYYELRTGHLPFDDALSVGSIVLAHQHGKLEFNSPILTGAEREILKQATSVRPAERFPSCGKMIRTLARAFAGLPPPDAAQSLIDSQVASDPEPTPPPVSDADSLIVTPALPPPRLQPLNPLPANPVALTPDRLAGLKATSLVPDVPPPDRIDFDAVPTNAQIILPELDPEDGTEVEMDPVVAAMIQSVRHDPPQPVRNYTKTPKPLTPPPPYPPPPPPPPAWFEDAEQKRIAVNRAQVQGAVPDAKRKPVAPAAKAPAAVRAAAAPSAARPAAVWYFARMRPGRSYPLRIELAPSAGRPVEFEPVLPGCDVSPPVMEIRPGGPPAVFHVVPQLAGPVVGGRLLADGVARAGLRTVAADLTPGWWLLAAGVLFPYLAGFAWIVHREVAASLPLYGDLGRFAETVPVWAGSVLFALAGAAVLLVRRPREIMAEFDAAE